MRIHFIAIGGSIMHSLAIALHKQGHCVTGSDDVIFGLSKERLEGYGLLPKKFGWDVNNILKNIDLVILGMHAKPDNPELLAAQDLGLKIHSFPEYIYEASQTKTRVVIAGSHGKTTTTSMVMHALRENKIEFDYAIGSTVTGFDNQVKLTDAPIIIIEGDEYLSSPIDRRPKFFHYKPDILLITGIAWDHINVFPTYDNYVDQFIQVLKMNPEAKVISNLLDPEVERVIGMAKTMDNVPYSLPDYSIEDNLTTLLYQNKKYPLKVFGKHNLNNMEGASEIALSLGISKHDFLNSMVTYSGTGGRMEVLLNKDDLVIIRDFAHAPSKAKATVEAVREQFPHQKITAVFELHTYSSLSYEFLPQYKGCLDKADEKIIFYDQDALKIKGKELEKEKVSTFFDEERIINDIGILKNHILNAKNFPGIFLLMSSGALGNFNPLEIHTFAKTLKHES